jgi:hypothetical protein
VVQEIVELAHDLVARADALLEIQGRIFL